MEERPDGFITEALVKAFHSIFGQKDAMHFKLFQQFLAYFILIILRHCSALPSQPGNFRCILFLAYTFNIGTQAGCQSTETVIVAVGPDFADNAYRCTV